MSKNQTEQQNFFHMQRHETSVNGNGHVSAPGDPENIRRIEISISYMIQHFNKPMQVAKLAALVNISPSHYFALFKRQTGCAPIDYFIRLRMERARRLLDTTSLNVKEIASELGYEDPFYFSRVFKSVNRVSPSEYRLNSAGQKSKINGATPRKILPALSNYRTTESAAANGRKLNGFSQSHR
jgi:transcriptional regulator GlxA family with amidase domain